MLRFKILASALPLLIAGIFARTELASSTHPCIAIGETTVQIASTPWQAQLHVSFTDDPAAATVRVQITDNAETADFAVIDDAGTADGNACAVTAATKFIGIANEASPSAPVIYLSRDDGGDYRIFVRSKTFSATGMRLRLSSAQVADIRVWQQRRFERNLFPINRFLIGRLPPRNRKHFATSPTHLDRHSQRSKGGKCS